MKTSELLDKAADVIERNGWTNHEWFTSAPGKRQYESPVDAWGAINVARGYAPDNPLSGSVDAARALALHVGLADTGDRLWPSWELGAWNDAPGRTAEEVVRALRTAAASERGAGR